MEMEINKTSVDQFYKEMFKGSDKNQQLRALELAFNALIDNKMTILNKELAKLSAHNVFNKNGAITMEKEKGGGFVFQIHSLQINGKDYAPIVLKGNNILNIMDQLIENIAYLEAFVNIAEQTTKNLKKEDKNKVTNVLVKEAYKNFPNPSNNLKDLEKDTKARVTIKFTIENIVEKLPPKIKETVTNLKDEKVITDILKQVSGNPDMIENDAKEKVSLKIAETIENATPLIANEVHSKKALDTLSKDLEKAIETTPLAEKVNPEAIKQVQKSQGIAMDTHNYAAPKSIDEALNRLENIVLDDKKGVTERPLNKEELAKITPNKNPYPNIKLSEDLEKQAFKELSPEEFQNLGEKEQQDYLKKQEEFQQNFVGPMPLMKR